MCVLERATWGGDRLINVLRGFVGNMVGYPLFRQGGCVVSVLVVCQDLWGYWDGGSGGEEGG